MLYQTTLQKFILIFTICFGLIIFLSYVLSLNLFITHVQQIRIIASYLASNKVNGKSRDRCCVSTGPELKDICGRDNCTSACSIPVSFNPELDNGKASFAKGERAFFLETMGNDKLDFRQACAVESLALLNPTLNVYVLFTGGQVDYTDDTLKVLKKKYSNLNFVGIDLEKYVVGTPLEHWYQCTDWEKGPYHVAHLSDGLRLLTLSKYGGYYFDLDVIQLRPIINYHNFTGTENGNVASNGVLHASYGHPLIKMAVEDFAKNYRADIWGYNGPALLTRVLKKWCGVEKFESVNSKTCQGFQVLPRSSFYPLPYDNWKEYFAENNATMDNLTPSWLTKEVISVHVWNKMSAEELIRKNSTQLYVKFAKKSCPITLSLAPYQF